MATHAYYQDPGKDPAADAARLEALEAETLEAYAQWEQLCELADAQSS